MDENIKNNRAENTLWRDWIWNNKKSKRPNEKINKNGKKREKKKVESS